MVEYVKMYFGGETAKKQSFVWTVYNFNLNYILDSKKALGFVGNQAFFYFQAT